MKSPTKIAVLTSGGLDSAILLDQLTKKSAEVWPIYVRGGLTWEHAEVKALRQFISALKSKRIRPLTILNLSWRALYGNHWSITGKQVPGAKSRDDRVYLPGKNLLLITQAAVFCARHKIHDIALAPLKTNPFPDANTAFFKTMEQVCTQALGHAIKIHVPFLKLSKKQVMQLGKKLPLERTFSCIHPKGNRHCGSCNKCAERQRAFKSLNP